MGFSRNTGTGTAVIIISAYLTIPGIITDNLIFYLTMSITMRHNKKKIIKETDEYGFSKRLYCNEY